MKEPRNKFNVAFGAKLKVLRRKLGITQSQTAYYLGVTRSTYAYYETGKVQPSLETLRKIARLYGVSADYLLDNNS